MHYNKTKVKEYLYPTIEAEELLKIINENIYKLIDTEILINPKNINKEYRGKNYRKLYNLVEEFFNQNYDLYDKLLNAWHVGDVYIEEIIIDVIYNLVFDYLQKQKRFKNMNIFKNKQSICYDEELSLYDILVL
mgnify:CR=1 FL=1